MVNQKGNTTLWIIVGVIAIGLVVAGLGLISFITDKIDEPLSSIDFCTNATSTQFDNYSCFHNQYAEKITPVVTTVQTTFVKIVSVGIVVGMILVMSFISWIAPKKNKLWLIADIIIVGFFIVVSAILSSAFNTYIHSTDELLAIYSGANLSLGASAVLNLPWIVAVLGMFIMIIDYSTAKKEEPQVYGY